MGRGLGFQRPDRSAMEAYRSKGQALSAGRRLPSILQRSVDHLQEGLLSDMLHTSLPISHSHPPKPARISASASMRQLFP